MWYILSSSSIRKKRSLEQKLETVNEKHWRCINPTGASKIGRAKNT